MTIDLLIKNAKVFNSFLKKFEDKNVAILKDKFYYISPSDQNIDHLEVSQILDAKGKYIVPGLIDIHMHIESSMVPPTTFSGAALSHGVTTIVADSHEIANVFGIEGLNVFMEQDTDLDIFYAIPSSVPSTVPERETTGGIIGIEVVEALLDYPKVIALGEAMNFKGIVSEPNSLIRQILKTTQERKPFMPLEGHIPRVSSEDLAKFMYAGLTADHTHQSPESILEKVGSGLFVEFQRKSLTKENIDVVNQHQLYEHTCIITDDIMPDDLLKGHLNANLKLAMDMGLSPENAIYMSTYTPARRMGFQDRGAIASGFKADFIILDDLETFHIHKVYKSGRLAYQDGDEMAFDKDLSQSFPAHFYNSVQCQPLTASDLRIAVDDDVENVLCNVIQIQAVGTFTECVQRQLPVKDGYLDWESSGLALIVVVERYGKNGQIGYGLVENTIQQDGAIATTWAHDHHNLMVMGTSIESMLAAQEDVISNHGGYTVAKAGEVIASCPLPIGGILSEAPLPVLGESLQKVRQAMVDLGYVNTNEIMSFSTLSLPVSPQLKITDFGMMDVHTHELIPLVEVKN
ncbi:adenine deaminase C-terminal domain-containing protein [Aerococcaceae bacterium WGS1372]